MDTKTYGFNEIRLLTHFTAVAVPITGEVDAGQVLSFDTETGLYYPRHIQDTEDETDTDPTSKAEGVLLHSVKTAENEVIMAPMVTSGTLRASALIDYQTGDMPAIVVLPEEVG